MGILRRRYAELSNTAWERIEKRSILLPWRMGLEDNTAAQLMELNTLSRQPVHSNIFFSPPLNKLNHTFLRDPPPVPDPEPFNLSRMQQLKHGILPYLQQRTALTERHNLGYISVHNKISFKKFGL